jgi:Tat protein secretion system quality control protein TatD with DNase activity
LIDAHIHLDHFADPVDGWAKLRAAGVRQALVPGVAAARPALRMNGIDNAAGQHPCFAADDDWTERLATTLASGAAAAVGELGYDRRGKAGHRAWVTPQIELAATHHLPLIVHLVGDRGDLLEQVSGHPYGAMLHRCSGRPSRFEAWWQAGVFISVGPTVGDDLRLLGAVPDHLLLLESDAESDADSPWDTLPALYAAAAQAKGCTLASIRAQIAANYARFIKPE